MHGSMVMTFEPENQLAHAVPETKWSTVTIIQVNEKSFEF